MFCMLGRTRGMGIRVAVLQLQSASQSDFVDAHSGRHAHRDPHAQCLAEQLCLPESLRAGHGLLSAGQRSSDVATC